MFGYFTVLAAIPGFFLSSLILMALWGVIAPKLGIADTGYPLAMLVTITLWLTVAPLAAAAGPPGKKITAQFDLEFHMGDRIPRGYMILPGNGLLRTPTGRVVDS